MTDTALDNIRHDERKLPKWAQKRLVELRQRDADVQNEMARFKQAYDILHHRKGWFSISGPPDLSVRNGCYHLFYLANDGAHSACILDVGDVLLIGRSDLPRELQPR